MRPEPGEARLLASGALVQQAAQASGLVALLVVVTVLARRLSRDRAGRLRPGRVAGRLPARAAQQRRRGGRPRDGRRPPWRRTARARSPRPPRSTRASGLVTGLLIAGGRVRDRRGRCSTAAWPRTRGSAGSGLGAVTAAGIAASVYLDGLRAERLLVRAALTEMAGVALWLALMLALILSGAGLGAVIAASGAMPLLSGLLSLAVVRRARLPFRLRPGAGRVHEIVPTAGWLLVVELSNLVSYAFQRVILGAFRSPGAGGPLRGPAARPQPALRAGRRAGGAHGAHRLALRGHRRRPPPARAGAARQPLHAGAVRARLRDPDGAGGAAAARLARRPLRRGRHGADDPRLVLAPLRGAGGHARASSWARAGRARWRS